MDTLIGILVFLFIAALPIILVFVFVELKARKQVEAKNRVTIKDVHKVEHLVQQKSFLPSRSDSRKSCIAIGVGALVSSAVELYNPTLQPPTGRWSWITATIFNAFGSTGLAVLWTALGLFLILIATSRNE
jgi:hypothetical protein